MVLHPLVQMSIVAQLTHVMKYLIPVSMLLTIANVMIKLVALLIHVQQLTIVNMCLIIACVMTTIFVLPLIHVLQLLDVNILSKIVPIHILAPSILASLQLELAIIISLYVVAIVLYPMDITKIALQFSIQLVVPLMIIGSVILEQ